MAEHPANFINYLFSIESQHRDYLGQIRHWSNLKMASDGTLLWVKDLTERQLNNLALQSIPFKQLYYEKEGLLFRLGERVPLRKQPSLLWSPITKMLPIELPVGNYNFFGFEEKFEIRLKQTAAERPAFGILASLTDLHDYIETAAAIRLEALQWVILKQHLVFIVGAPLLPIKGFTYWQKGDFLLPTGFEFELEILTADICKKVNASSENWVLWNKDASYILLPKSALKPLSIGSFRLSVQDVASRYT